MLYCQITKTIPLHLHPTLTTYVQIWINYDTYIFKTWGGTYPQLPVVPPVTIQYLYALTTDIDKVVWGLAGRIARNERTVGEAGSEP